mgnify:CR=1 FL=1
MRMTVGGSVESSVEFSSGFLVTQLSDGFPLEEGVSFLEFTSAVGVGRIVWHH